MIIYKEHSKSKTTFSTQNTPLLKPSNQTMTIIISNYNHKNLKNTSSTFTKRSRFKNPGSRRTREPISPDLLKINIKI